MSFLKKGTAYSLKELDSIFDFEYKEPSGIKLSQTQNAICLFYSPGRGKYPNIEHKGVLTEYIGQGSAPQKLIYANKSLYDCYKNKDTKIYVFRNYVYCGEFYVCKEPFFNNDSLWIFPVCPVG